MALPSSGKGRWVDRKVIEGGASGGGGILEDGLVVTNVQRQANVLDLLTLECSVPRKSHLGSEAWGQSVCRQG